MCNTCQILAFVAQEGGLHLLHGVGEPYIGQFLYFRQANFPEFCFIYSQFLGAVAPLLWLRYIIQSVLDYKWFHETLYIFGFLYKRVPRFYECHVFKFFWQIFIYFLDFKTIKNFSYTWEIHLFQ